MKQIAVGLMFSSS